MFLERVLVENLEELLVKHTIVQIDGGMEIGGGTDYSSGITVEQTIHLE